MSKKKTAEKRGASIKILHCCDRFLPRRTPRKEKQTQLFLFRGVRAKKKERLSRSLFPHIRPYPRPERPPRTPPSPKRRLWERIRRAPSSPAAGRRPICPPPRRTDSAARRPDTRRRAARPPFLPTPNAETRRAGCCRAGISRTRRRAFPLLRSNM